MKRFYIATLVCFLIFGSLTIFAQEVEVEQRDFPRLYVVSELHPFEQERAFWHDAYISLVGADNPEWDFDDAAVMLRGRGNTSWAFFPEKRPFRFRLPSGEARSMLGAGHEARDWTLIANQSDKSLMRNFSAYYLASQLDGMAWASVAFFVHVYINGEYYGVYQLSDQIEAGAGREQVTFNDDPRLSEFFLEMDWRAYRSGEEGVDFFRVNTGPDGIQGQSRQSGRDFLYEFRFPGGSIRTRDHVDYAQDFVTRASQAIRNRNWDEITAIIDIDSFIDWYIVQEVYRNVDSGWSSVNLSIRGQGPNRRLYLGPVWDFDVAANNTSWQSNQTPYGGLYVTRQHYWFSNLMNTPEFAEAVTYRWNNHAKQAVINTIARIEYMAAHYYDAFNRNFEAHDILGIYTWPNPPQVYEIDTFYGQVEYLTDFLYRRMMHLDETLNNN